MAAHVQLVLMMLFVAAAVATAESDWTQNCNRCKCVWSSGKKFADCHSLQLTSIPRDLSGELREIDFSHNPLHELADDAFHAVGLHNVHKLKLDNCSLSVVDAHAFQHLQLLIEVYLAHNALQHLDADVFADNGKLRVISLAGNRLRYLAANTFANLTHLQRLNLDGNRLDAIDADVFGRNCTLRHLNLQNNRLHHLAADFTAGMPKLNSLDIHGNPWRCDCQLDAFRRLTLDNTWVTTTVVCEHPQRLRGRRWSDVDVVFACAPRIIQPPPAGALLEADDDDGASNFTLACLVEGTPRPTVTWFMSGTRIAATNGAGVRKYERTSSSQPYWDNLTIINMSYRDRGEYRCVAANAAGSDERNFSLYLHGDEYGGGGVSGGGGVYVNSMSDAMLLIVTLAVTTTILLILILLLLCYCWRRRRRASLSSKSRPVSSDASEFISMERRASEKSLLTDVNPVIKPPRQGVAGNTTPACGGSTDLSETRKMLLDDECVYRDDDDDLKMYDRGSSRGGSVIGILGGGAARSVDIEPHHHYPPDLLSFPARYAATQQQQQQQISPAGSSASTVADTTRLPVHHISNGMTSPVHGGGGGSFFDTPPPSLYRTLPYSRSHSPFAAPHHHQLLSVRVARPGAYVTIPRRPRMSWSSEPPGGVSMTPEVCEPVYDNLGLRATAKGTSALSLHKLTDGGRQPFSLPCTPIVEHTTSNVATLPRSLHRERALSPLGVESLRGSWGCATPETDGEELRSPKIPPRPPPKPKKRVAAGPLFEDEGEDGTEV